MHILYTDYMLYIYTRRDTHIYTHTQYIYRYTEKIIYIARVIND